MTVLDTPDSQTSSPADRLLAWLVGITLVAVGLRGWLYAQRLSFWNDEAAIVINVVDRDARHLLDPLDYAQVAPPGFLRVHKGVLGSVPGEV
jgi:hypothetical protein